MLLGYGSVNLLKPRHAVMGVLHVIVFPFIFLVSTVAVMCKGNAYIAGQLTAQCLVATVCTIILMLVMLLQKVNKHQHVKTHSNALSKSDLQAFQKAFDKLDMNQAGISEMFAGYGEKGVDFFILVRANEQTINEAHLLELLHKEFYKHVKFGFIKLDGDQLNENLVHKSSLVKKV